MGVLVMDGGKGKFAASTCVPASATKLDGTVIATQCCYANGKCARYYGHDDVENCFSGHSRHGGVRPTTYAEGVELCAEFGLSLCKADNNCAYMGCGYNSHPIWTSQTCELPADRRRADGYTLQRRLQGTL
jgi:hypothetical protein